MSIWFKDNRKVKAECVQATQKYKSHGDIEKALLEIDAALNDGILKNKLMLSS